MPEDEEKEGEELRRAAAWADMSTEERNKEMKRENAKNPPWAAGINPFKRDDSDEGMSPREFFEMTKERDALPKGNFGSLFIKVGSGYSAGGLKVKVPKEGGEEGEFELIDMNKYNDPYNATTLKGRPYMSGMEDKFGNKVGYGQDVRGVMVSKGLLRNHTEQQMRGAYQHESRKVGRREFDSERAEWRKREKVK